MCSFHPNGECPLSAGSVVKVVNVLCNSVGYNVQMTEVGQAGIVAVIDLIGYSVIIALTGLPIGYSVMVVLLQDKVRAQDSCTLFASAANSR